MKGKLEANYRKQSQSLAVKKYAIMRVFSQRGWRGLLKRVEHIGKSVSTVITEGVL
jgi:hypothetical protein